ncbi:hypothetical protein WA026_014383 [Henosepilachna vigintioctopunctata]|uniref:Uncharacterized protein n=1 Tax=Henosepilachna vigintioctopunctata TaxID=420089 RepID=A0AAW1UIW9_9CUCU
MRNVFPWTVSKTSIFDVHEDECQRWTLDENWSINFFHLYKLGPIEIEYTYAEDQWETFIGGPFLELSDSNFHEDEKPTLNIREKHVTSFFFIYHWETFFGGQLLKLSDSNVHEDEKPDLNIRRKPVTSFFHLNKLEAIKIEDTGVEDH